MKSYKNKRYQPWVAVFLLLAAAVVVQGCKASGTTPFVVIRGEFLRSNVYVLPLEQEKITELLGYVKKGGNIKDTDTADFYNETYYKGLLDVLSKDKDGDGKFEMEDLFDMEKKKLEGRYILAGGAAQHFIPPKVNSIFDSRLKRPNTKSYHPFALADQGKNLWWVFYRKKGEHTTIEGVMATVPIFKDLQHFKK
jgi:hypothetical protein